MDSICQHIVQRLRAVACESAPFPHLFVTGLLPADFYVELIHTLPDLPHYHDCGPSYYVDGRPTRHCLPLSDERLQHVGGPGADLWRLLRDALCSGEVKSALYETLAEGLAYRFRIDPSEAASLPGYPTPTLYRETEGYSIAPHPDTRKKIITMQLALPADQTQCALGTAIYRRNAAQLLHRPRGFVQVKQFPFLPNSAYAFVVLNGLGKKSWHGREALQSEQGVRNTLLNIYGAAPNPDFPAPEPAALRELLVR